MNSSNQLSNDQMKKNDKTGSNEPRPIAPEDYAEHPDGSDNSSDAILNTLRAKHQSDTGRWLNSLAEEISKPAEPTSPQVQEREQANATGTLLDRMFNEFQKYASEFNQTVQGTDFIVNCLHPAHVYELPKGSTYSGDLAPGKIGTFEGHLSTRYWAMLVRGQYGKIEIFITPSINLLGFSAEKSKISEIVPFMSIEAVWKDGGIKWYIYGEELLPNAVAPLTKELFGDLIKVASGTMRESDIATKNVNKGTLTSAPETDFSLAPTAGRFNIHASLRTIAISNDLIAAIETDIKQLLTAGKQAIDANDRVKLDQTRRMAATLGSLLKSHKRFIADLKKMSG